MRAITIKKRLWAIKALSLIAIVSIFAVIAWAVDLQGFFELGDGLDPITQGSADILGDPDPPGQPGPDWQDLFNGDGSLKDVLPVIGIPDVKDFGGIDAVFLADDLSVSSLVDDTIYASSNKNNDLIATWNWDTGNVPPKDDLANGYAYATINDTDELLVYAGIERLAPQGASHIDIELNQASVGLDKEPACGDDESDGVDDNPPCEFVGEKTPDDLLIVMDFEQGGTLGFVEVRKWADSDIDGIFEYELVDQIQPDPNTGSAEGCNAADTVCAVNNSTDIDGGPWDNFDRHGNIITDLPANAFTEVGINVTALIGATPCIGTIQLKSRSSPSFNSELKDFALGAFDLCSMNVEKEGDSLSKVGDIVNYTVTITNDGGITLYKEDISDDVLGDITVNGVDQGNSNVSSNTCGSSLGQDESCTVTLQYTVQQGDPDPLENTVTATYNLESDFSGSQLEVSDVHSVNLFQPSISLSKTGPAMSKAGDGVTYTVTILNTSSDDTPDLIVESISDTLQGNLTAPANYDSNTCGATLAHGIGCSIIYTYIVQAGDLDPLVNTASIETHPDGFTNDIDASDSHSVNIFTADFTITKTGDTLSKNGDGVTYTFTITNTSSDDAPDLVLQSISDTKLGDLSAEAGIAGCGTLSSPGGLCTFNVNHTIPLDNTEDPYNNTVTATYQVEGFPNTITKSESHSVELFQPSVNIDKTGDTLSKIGDSVTYNFTISNTSSGDTPNLMLDSISDTVLGSLATEANNAGCGSLASGNSCNFSKDYTIQGGDPDPLNNTVTVHYHPAGFSNDITDNDSHSVNLFQPSVDITKTGDTLSKVGDPVNYTITVTNTSSSDTPILSCTVSDALLGLDKDVSLVPGAQDITQISRTVQGGDPDPLPNTASVICTVFGFGNVVGDSDSHSVNLFQPSISLTKTGPDYSKAGDDTIYTVLIENNSSVDTPDLIIDSITDTLQGDLTDPANVNSSTCGASLVSGNSCTIEYNYIVQVSDPDLLENTASVETHPEGFTNDIDASDSHSVTILHPNFTVDKECTPKKVQVGASINYTITIENTGDVPLNYHIEDEKAGVDEIRENHPTQDDPAYLPIVIETSVSVEQGQPTHLTNTVVVTATLPEEFGLDNEITKDSTDTCEITTEGATRTLGFWRTHYDYTKHVFEAHLGGSIDLGWITLENYQDVFGVFWANKAHESDGTRRDRLCQTRVRVSSQALAAILNSGLDNGAGLPVSIAEIIATLSGTDINAINVLGGTLDAYNNSGDDVAIVDNDGTAVLPADPNEAKANSDLTAADCPDVI